MCGLDALFLGLELVSCKDSADFHVLQQPSGDLMESTSMLSVRLSTPNSSMHGERSTRTFTRQPSREFHLEDSEMQKTISEEFVCSSSPKTHLTSVVRPSPFRVEAVLDHNHFFYSAKPIISQ